MDAAAQAVIEECTTGSDQGTMTFPQVVGRLFGIGLEQYHVDFRRGERTFTLPDGDSYRNTQAIHAQPGAIFDASAVEATIRTIQRGEIDYQEFCRRVIDAGCVGYFVSLAGRRAVYYGRGLETLVEPFPAQA